VSPRGGATSAAHERSEGPGQEVAAGDDVLKVTEEVNARAWPREVGVRQPGAVDELELCGDRTAEADKDEVALDTVRAGCDEGVARRKIRRSASPGPRGFALRM
jgi:hypothetical protein